jgi:HD superfamily phosphodiesterase
LLKIKKDDWTEFNKEMKLKKEIERKIKNSVMIYLKKGDSSYDVQHTVASVYWIRRLLEKEGGNEKILVPTMYFHDIGYYGLIKDNKDWKKRMAAKKKHMKRGAVMAVKILKEIKGFTDKQIKEILRLIRTHDLIEEKKNLNEQLVFEADSLAMADRKRYKTTISKSNYKKFVKLFKKDRVPLFKTKTGKKFLSKFINTL